MNCRITVVTVSFNAARVIEPTIKSVIAQTYDNLEYIIIDGGSKDETLNIVNKYKGRVICFSEPDKGIYDGMNKGIRRATGEWIIFMNAGDRFLCKDTVKNVFDNTVHSEDVGVVYGDYYVTNGEYAKLHDSECPFWNNNSYLHSSGICHQASFVRKKIALEYLFDLNYKHAADMKMFVDIYNGGYKYLHVKEPICLFDVTENYGTKNPWSGVLEQARILNRYGTFRFYLSMVKDAIVVKPEAWLARNVKLFIKKIDNKSYLKFLSNRGWRKISEVTQDDWGVVAQY